MMYSLPTGSCAGPLRRTPHRPRKGHPAPALERAPDRREMRTEKHDVFVPVLYHRGVVNRFHRLGDGRLSEDGVAAVSSDDVIPHVALQRSSRERAPTPPPLFRWRSIVAPVAGMRGDRFHQGVPRPAPLLGCCSESLRDRVQVQQRSGLRKQPVLARHVHRSDVTDIVA